MLSEVEVIADSDYAASRTPKRGIQTGEVVQQTVPRSGDQIVDLVKDDDMYSSGPVHPNDQFIEDPIRGPSSEWDGRITSPPKLARDGLDNSVLGVDITTVNLVGLDTLPHLLTFVKQLSEDESRDHCLAWSWDSVEQHVGWDVAIQGVDQIPHQSLDLVVTVR